jgi:multidrug efflux pump subunit AcrB
MKHTFSILLTLCIFLIIGLALIPGLDIADKPRPRQGKTLTVSYSWNGASAKVIEQNVTSRIEGLVSSVNGVESVNSVSEFGSGRVEIQLKKEADVSSVKFEISSLLRQVSDKFPKDVRNIVLAGGEVVTSKNSDERSRPLFTYCIRSDMPNRDIRSKAEKMLKPVLERLDGVRSVDVTGGNELYTEISYDAERMSLYGITSQDIETAIQSYIGREDVVGDVYEKDLSGNRERISLYLTMKGDSLSIEQLPIKMIGDKIVYLNNLATVQTRERDPHDYYRINGENTVYMNVYADDDASIRTVSRRVSEKLAELDAEQEGEHPLRWEVTYDRAEEQLAEFSKLITRSGMSLVILLLFVFLSRRELKYLFIITTTLVSNILLAVICYRVFDLRLHPFSMAGITVSLGLIIDSAIVMVDHYSYYHNYKAFHGILGAMLTTIGSLIIIFWLPDYLKNDLYDFSWMVIINLAVALVVSAFFAPALVDRLHYTGRQTGRPRRIAFVQRWNRWYSSYICVAQHRIFRWVFLLIAAALFGGSLYLFMDTLDAYTYLPPKAEKKLYIRGAMPLGGTAKQLNEKVELVEAFLSQYPQIKRFETGVSESGSYTTVEFKPEYRDGSFPYLLENKVISKLITIGGADWSTYGVSDRGFSNSLNLQYRSNRIEITGYDYDRLYRYAEEMCSRMKENPRVADLTIETPGHENQQDELFMEYNHERMTLDSVRVSDVYTQLSGLLAEHDLRGGAGSGEQMNITLRPRQYSDFDLWRLENAFIKVSGRDVRVSDYMNITRREAKNCIPRANQEYVLRVAFNVLGSYNYSSKYIKGITEEFNAKFPVGFRCVNSTYGFYEDDGTQYWLIGLVVLIIFFVCAILFESLYKSLVIILLIPVSLSGMFLVYHFGGLAFGTGGYAALVLLCGLVVNAGIYLMNEYNTNGHNYLKAYNHKIIPICLTVFSTILGLIPFLIDGPEEQFWFSFAVGSGSGLAFSIIVLPLLLPPLLKKK